MKTADKYRFFPPIKKTQYYLIWIAPIARVAIAHWWMYLYFPAFEHKRIDAKIVRSIKAKRYVKVKRNNMAGCRWNSSPSISINREDYILSALLCQHNRMASLHSSQAIVHCADLIVSFRSDCKLLLFRNEWKFKMSDERSAARKTSRKNTNATASKFLLSTFNEYLNNSLDYAN